MSDRNTYLIEKMQSAGITIDAVQSDMLNTYFDMVIEKNKVMNLTAITEYEDFILKHFIDSMMFVRSGIDVENRSLIDVGTGAGFPGIPLKILFPSLKVTLMDSLNKRLLFLDDVIRELSLNGIETVHARAEELGRKEEYREQYDIAVSRAVANLSTLSEFCIPFVKRSGYFVSYKSGEVQTELLAAGKAIDILGGKLERTIEFTLPGSDMNRSLIIIKKQHETSSKYPRSGGKPIKEPLGV